ncbi:MAG: hypothetical protein OQK82_09230 [Candidatus Pacearchaeota archaeon]|nr:hypothetical protein [Candidatus Pacearchaeota archaeon]
MNEKQIKEAWTALKPNRVDKAIAEVEPLVYELKQRKMRKDGAKKHKMKIAEIALSVCPLDGRELNRIADRSPDVSTIAEFSKLIGIKYGSLRHWVNAFLGGVETPIGAPIPAKDEVPPSVEKLSGAYLLRSISFKNVLKYQDTSKVPRDVKIVLRLSLREILERLEG